MSNNTLSYIYEWCLKNNIQAEIISEAFLCVQNEIIFHENWFYKNSTVSNSLAIDKKAAQVFLASHGHDILDQEVFFFPRRRFVQSMFNVKAYADSLGYPVVFKPNNWSFGEDVYKVSSETECLERLEYFIGKYGHVNVSRFLEVKNEYGAYVYEGEVQIMYKKSLGRVSGDGKKTYYELLLRSQIKDIADFIRSTPADGLSLEAIIPKGKEIFLGWKFRLDNAGSIVDLLSLDQLTKDEIALKEQAGKASRLMNLELCAVDFYETKEGKLLINEINSGFMIDNLVKLGPKSRLAIDNLLGRIFIKFMV